jgi:dihydrofolate synthase/folylpolyglutamate synthase
VDDPAAALEAVLARFRNARRVSPAFGLDHIRGALARLDNPQDRIPAAIHITGTNGKGSAGAFIRAMAEAAGLKVHAFTSPHLVRVNERIRVAGALVDDATLTEALERVESRSADIDGGLTYFEGLAAAAFLLFAETPADLSIIEVGAGGATDATNVMARPAAALVTPISLDHESMFGVQGEAAIARLKAGIFRPGVPAIVADQPAPALHELLAAADALGAPVRLARRDWSSGWDGDAFAYSGARFSVRAPWLGLPGRHQHLNAGAACAVIEALDDPRLTPDVMAAGLREVVWPARLQRLGPGPLTDDCPAAIWIDAAHNPGGAVVLADAIRAARPSLGGDRAVLVIALQGAKDAAGVIAALAPAVDDVIACPIPDSGGQEGGPGADPARLVALARQTGVHAMAAADLREALRLAAAGGANRIYIAGSLYLCGAVLRDNGERPT